MIYWPQRCPRSPGASATAPQDCRHAARGARRPGESPDVAPWRGAFVLTERLSISRLVVTYKHFQLGGYKQRNESRRFSRFLFKKSGLDPLKPSELQQVMQVVACCCADYTEQRTNGQSPLESRGLKKSGCKGLL